MKNNEKRLMAVCMRLACCCEMRNVI